MQGHFDTQAGTSVARFIRFKIPHQASEIHLEPVKGQNPTIIMCGLEKEAAAVQRKKAEATKYRNRKRTKKEVILSYDCRWHHDQGKAPVMLLHEPVRLSCVCPPC